MASMKTISLYIEPSQLKRLKAWSKETGAPVSELIRRAIEAALKTWAAKKD
jgi:predicted DNA-binding protein